MPPQWAIIRDVISILKGRVVDTGVQHAIVMVGGIGLTVALTKAAAISLGGREDEVTLLTYLAVREDALDLYGFLADNERQMFELLLTVPGIGPRGALAVLDIGDIPALASAIVRSDVGYLTGVSGIGKKTAEKIVVELREKARPLASKDGHQGESEVFEALRSLGYNAADIRGALKDLPDDTSTTNDRLREALRLLSKHR